MTEVEIRNDIPDVVGHRRARGREGGGREGRASTILSINALYPFNVWSGDLPGRAVALADYAQACGAKALVMCPLNDGTTVAHDDLVAALKAMAPILRERGLTGLVEPLGFPISSMRTKAEAIAAIEAAEGGDVYKLVHDTFHHHLAGETEFFPERTGIVHISGVVDPDVAVDDMLDRAPRARRCRRPAGERDADRGAACQRASTGRFSFEPFADEVQALADPEAALRESMTSRDRKQLRRARLTGAEAGRSAPGGAGQPV